MNYSWFFDILRELYSKFAFDYKTGKIKMPLRYVLELTYRCNLKCPFCYITGERNIDELSTGEWLNIIEQIPPFSMVSFVAGEVLLKRDFDIIFKKACEKFRKASLITNGLLLNSEIIDLIIKNKLLLLSVSLDAIGNKHDELRCHKGLYDKVINNLCLFNEKRNKKNHPMLDIKTCILKNNLDDIPLLYKKAIELNAQYFSLTFIRWQATRQNSVLFNEFSDEINVKTYPIEPYFDLNHFKEIYRELEALQKNSKTIVRYAPRFSPTGDIDRIIKFFNSKNIPVKQLYKSCHIPMTSVYITPEGKLYPCLSIKTGDLKEMKLKDAINTVNAKCFRKNLYCAGVFNACQMCCDAIPK